MYVACLGLYSGHPQESKYQKTYKGIMLKQNIQYKLIRPITYDFKNVFVKRFIRLCPFVKLFLILCVLNDT